MANFDPNTGLPLAPQKKKGGKTALIIVGVVLLCALGFGFGASVRSFARARIVPKDSVPVYTLPEPGSREACPEAA